MPCESSLGLLSWSRGDWLFCLRVNMFSSCFCIDVDNNDGNYRRFGGRLGHGSRWDISVQWTRGCQIETRYESVGRLWWPLEGHAALTDTGECRPTVVAAGGRRADGGTQDTRGHYADRRRTECRMLRQMADRMPHVVDMMLQIANMLRHAADMLWTSCGETAERLRRDCGSAADRLRIGCG